MNWKNISSVLILILIVLGVVYLWNVQQQEKQEPNDPVFAMLEQMQESSNIESEITEQIFTWNVGGEKKIEIYGWSFAQEGLLDGTSHLYAFLESEGFSSDPYNVEAGIIGLVTGMKHENSMCLVDERVQVDNSGMPVPSGATDIVVSCGQTEESLDIEEILTEKIMQSFAEKYEVDLSSVEIDVQQRSDSHIRGVVTISDENAALEEDGIEPGGVGIFLAAKSDEEWVIVFDGNGSYQCADVEEYEFPADMIQDCTQQEEE